MDRVEIKAKTILRKMRAVDRWFIAGSGMNLYRGCSHDCAYCDGRAEKYRVEGEFSRRVEVKANALDVLARELGGNRGEQAELWPDTGQRSGGFILLGGGVGDSYQPAEKECLLARGTLALLAERGLPVHVLTKSSLVLRDGDLLQRIARTTAALVSFSISSSDDAVSAVFEPGASPPSERLRALSELRNAGINGGVFLMPVLPFITDGPEMMERSIEDAARAGAQYVVFGGMTLKQGRQKEHLRSVLSSYRPELVPDYERLYPPPPRGKPDWGNAASAYYRRITGEFRAAAARHGMPHAIPLELCQKVLSGEERARLRTETIP